MRTVERIAERVGSLPETAQREVLDFVEYLAHKLREEDAGWCALSVEAALRGLEGEVWPDYTEHDLKERWG